MLPLAYVVDQKYEVSRPLHLSQPPDSVTLHLSHSLTKTFFKIRNFHMRKVKLQKIIDYRFSVDAVSKIGQFPNGDAEVDFCQRMGTLFRYASPGEISSRHHR
jgi:hypothetical protein